MRIMFSSCSDHNMCFYRTVCQTKCTVSQGSPPETVLTPYLFILYTSDFTYNSGHCLHKFPDDSTVVRGITNGEEDEYRVVIQDFAQWCQHHSLQLNTNKTKERVVNFCRKKHSPTRLVNIHRVNIEVVQSTNTWVFTSTTSWTGQTTPVPCTKKDRVDSSLSCFMNLWWHQPSSMQWSPGAVTLQQQTGGDCTNS